MTRVPLSHQRRKSNRHHIYILFFGCESSNETYRYQNRDFSDPSSGGELSQYEALLRITDLFIRTGAREEVNIRCVGSTLNHTLLFCH